MRMRLTTLLPLLALVACPGQTEHQFDQGVQYIAHGAQAVAVATGQPWLAPMIGAGAALVTAGYHAFVGRGIPTIPTVPGTPTHRRRAIAKMQAAALKPPLDRVP